jgi:hypothetical protein
VFPHETAALNFIRSRIAKGTTVHADESASWNSLHARYEMKRINHQEAYSQDGACTNWAELFFSRLRRAEAIITTSPGLICYASLRKLHGARTIAAALTANKSARLRDWQ